MLWSMIIKPRTKYQLDRTKIPNVLHISKATLDINSATFASRDENTSLVMDHYNALENKCVQGVILCNLSLENRQENLDIDVTQRDFDCNKVVTLYSSNDKATIHVTGYTKKSY